MAHFHFDASGLVKYYVLEPGSTWVRSIIDAVDVQSGEPVHSISIIDISIAETTATFAVLYRTGRIHRGAWVGAFDLFMTVPLPVTFVSGDGTLLTAAGSEGLLTDNPFDHVLPLDTPSPHIP
jgi:hypothetical protein